MRLDELKMVLIIKFEVLWKQFNALWGEAEAGALPVEHLLLLGRSQMEKGVGQDVEMHRNPLGDPHKLV